MRTDWFADDEPKPAPMPLRLVQGFLNTWEGETGSDRFSHRNGVADWFGAAGLLDSAAPVSTIDRRTASSAREELRTLLAGPFGHADEPTAIRRLLAESPVLLTVDDTRLAVALAPQGTVKQALSQLFAVAFSAQVDGSLSRLKICRNDACRWAFYDGARNRGGIWCCMDECGNRLKNRQYRKRIRDQGSS